MRLATGSIRDDLFDWWCERFVEHNDIPFHSHAESRDRLVLRNLQQQTGLPAHQIMIAIDRWLASSSSPSIDVFCRAFDEDIAGMTEANDVIAVARIFVLARKRLNARQQTHIDALERAIMDYDDLSVAWDNSTASPESALDRIKKLTGVLERES